MALRSEESGSAFRLVDPVGRALAAEVKEHLLTGRHVKPTVGMTGEITLQGQVLPIGGVKQKVLAAHRMGLTEVVLPKRNGPDLDDVPERVRDEMTFHLAETYDDVARYAFVD